MQFVGSLFLMTGAAVFVLSLNFRLGIAALAAGLRRVLADHARLPPAGSSART